MAVQSGVPERRIVSVLFCDLVGFTDFSDGADPEDVDALLGVYFARARAAIEGHGGVVEKFIGDAVVGVFGHPLAHDDDPERAVRAGLAIVEAVAAGQDSGGPWLPVRVGVNTGEALLRRGVDPASGEGFMAGDMVNTAARIQHEAEPMSVLVGPGTHAATDRVFDYMTRGTVELRGKAEPVQVFQPLAALARIGSELTRTHDAPFVGRTGELAQLTGACQQVVTSSEPVLVRLVGEPGIGKSRLVNEFLIRADQRLPGMVWRTGRCLPYGDQAGVWALGEIVRSHLGVSDTDPVDVVAQRLDDVLVSGPDRAWLRERLLPLLGVTASLPGSAAEQLAAWSRFLRDQFAWSPTVLVFEDVHWADDTLLRFVHQLVNDAIGQPLMVVVTTRPEHRLDAVLQVPDEDRDPEVPLPASAQLVLNVSPLDEKASHVLLAALLAQPSVSDELAETIMSHSEGNPLFLGELVRLLRDRDLVTVDQHGAWQLVDDAKIPVPDSLHGVIAARIDLLPESTRALLGTASVLGRTFWPGAVEAMQPEVRPTLVTDLALAADRDLISTVPSTMTGQTEYAFFHALTRDVIYATLPRDRRAAGHQAAATWLEDQVGQRTEEIADVLAHHAVVAIDLYRASGQGDRADEVRPRAVRYLYRSALQILQTDNALAIRKMEQALEVAGADHAERSRMLVEYSHALRNAASPDRALSAAQEAVELSRRHGSEEDLAHAENALLLAADSDRSGISFDFETVERRWVERVLQLPTSELTVQALTRRADRSWYVDHDSARALANYLAAVDAAAEVGSQQAFALVVLGVARMELGEAQGVVDLQRAISVGRQTGDTFGMLLAYHNLGPAMVFVGPAPLIPQLREGLHLSRERGYLRAALSIGHNLESLLSEAGQLAEALTLRKEVREAEGVPDRWLALFSAAEDVSLAELTGDSALLAQLSDLLERYDDAELVDPPVPEYLKLLTQNCVLDVVRSVGDPGRLATLVSGMRDDLLRRMGAHNGQPVLSLLKCALQVNDLDLAEQITTGVAATNPMLAHAHLHGRAMVDEWTGRLVQAVDGYVAVAERWGRFGSHVNQADALLGAARCQAALRKHDEARSLATAALHLYEAMPAAAKVAECDALLVEQLKGDNL